MKWDKIKGIFYKCILILLILILGYVNYCSIFNIYQSSNDLKPIIIIIGSVVMILFLLKIKSLLSKFSEKKINIAASILCIMFFLGMSIFGNLMTSIPSNDLSNIIRECNIMINQGSEIVSEGYFARYPNQVPLVILVYIIYKIGIVLKISLQNLNNFATIINSLFMAITAYFTYLSVKKMKNERWGFLSLIFFVINPIFYLYSSYFYTDTLCMPFAAIAIYLYIYCNSINKEKKKIFLFVISGFVLSIGLILRVVLGIILVAMIIDIILKKEKIRSKIKNIFEILCGLIIGVMLYTGISQQFGDIKNKNVEFPITNWIMYSLNEDSTGKWNSADFSTTLNQKTYEEKLEKNIEVIKQRLNKLGISGWINLSKAKLAVNWSNGDYDYISKLKNVENINKLYEYIVGSKSIVIIYYLQICKVVLMTMLFLACIKELKQEEKMNKFILISAFGAFAFYFIWEVLSRYSLTFLPWIILVFPTGMSLIEKMLNAKKIKIYFSDNKVFQVNINKARKIFFNSIIIFSILLAIINFEKYALKEEIYYDKVVVQEKSNENGIAKIADNIITQTFIVEKNFNCIAIKFKKADITNVTNYIIEILDAEERNIRTMNITSEQINESDYTTVFFDDIIPNEKEEYILKIYSNDATEENSLGIATYYGYGNYDIYPDGTLKINDEEIEEDITFKVQNRKDRTYVSKRLYIIIFILIISIEIFSLKSRKD